MIKMNENMLKKIIIDTIKGEQHLGENLKNLCVDYIEQLQNNWNELKKFLEEGKKVGQAKENRLSVNICNLILGKMQELEENNNER